jgi:hypothetical protein
MPYKLGIYLGIGEVMSRQKYYPCDECYMQASAQAGGNEEIGALAYEFLHYEFNHGIYKGE